MMKENEIQIGKPIECNGIAFEIVHHQNWRFYTWRRPGAELRYDDQGFIYKAAAYDDAIAKLRRLK